MNRTLLRARVAIALLLLVGIFSLVVLMLLRPPSLTADVKGIVEGAVAQLVILLGFAVHAIYQRGAETATNPTEPPPAANSQGPIAPEAK